MSSRTNSKKGAFKSGMVYISHLIKNRSEQLISCLLIVLQIIGDTKQWIFYNYSLSVRISMSLKLFSLTRSSNASWLPRSQFIFRLTFISIVYFYIALLLSLMNLVHDRSNPAGCSPVDASRQSVNIDRVGVGRHERWIVAGERTSSARTGSRRRWGICPTLESEKLLVFAIRLRTERTLCGHDELITNAINYMFGCDWYAVQQESYS